MRLQLYFPFRFFLLWSSAVAFVASTAQAVLINGAGATFPFPLYFRWFFVYHQAHPTVQINYQPVGSGGGIRQFHQGTLDFGATDIPLSDSQMDTMTQLLHFPVALGSLAIAYHGDSLPDGLQFSETALAHLFLGSLVFWDDPLLQQANPKIRLPHLPITLIRRSDGSGASAILTEYLSKISPVWKKQVGTGTSVKWPAGVGGKGNQGVADLVQQSQGAIGYLELLFAKAKKMKMAALENTCHRYILPSLASTTAAARESMLPIPPDLRFSLTRAPGEEAYPLAAFTYFLIKPEAKTSKDRAILAFLNWAIEPEGQRIAVEMDYAPLPTALVSFLKQKVQQLLNPPKKGEVPHASSVQGT